MYKMKNYDELIADIDAKIKANEEEVDSLCGLPGIKYIEVGTKDFGFGLKKIYGVCKAKDFQK